MTSTFWSYRQRAEVKDARQAVLDILPSRPRWNEEQLSNAAGITPRLFRLIISDLLEEELAHRESVQREAFYSVKPATRSSGKQVRNAELTPEAKNILAYLQARPDTIQHLSAALKIPTGLTAQALAMLQDEGMVSCRYVGMLTIYRRTT